MVVERSVYLESCFFEVKVLGSTNKGYIFDESYPHNIGIDNADRSNVKQ
jgi:hypothetical protein